MLPLPELSQSPESVNLVAPAFSTSIGPAAAAIVVHAIAQIETRIASLQCERTMGEYFVTFRTLQCAGRTD